MSTNFKLLSTLFLTFMCALIASGCSSPEDDPQSGKAAAQETEYSFQISSLSFTEIRPKKRIPRRNTCYGENLSPPLNWSGAPSETRSFALVVEDIDHHTGIPWVHWIIYDIPASVTEITEGVPTSTPELPDGSIQGLNDFKNIGYEGPCPIPVEIAYGGQHDRRAREEKTGAGPHRYDFKLYALDTVLNLESGKTKSKLLEIIEGHILSEANWLGKYQVRPVKGVMQ